MYWTDKSGIGHCIFIGTKANHIQPIGLPPDFRVNLIDHLKITESTWNYTLQSILKLKRVRMVQYSLESFGNVLVRDCYHCTTYGAEVRFFRATFI